MTCAVGFPGPNRNHTQNSSKQSIDPSMAVPTRDEFLSHVHQGLLHPETDPKKKKKGSPTKSTQRYRWRELLPWDVEAESRRTGMLSPTIKRLPRWVCCLYIGTLYSSSLTAILSRLRPNPGCEYHSVLPSKSRITLRFEALAMHAEMWTEGAQPDPQLLANCRLYNGV